MRLGEIEEALEALRIVALDDAEVAHEMEDDLYQMFVKYVAHTREGTVLGDMAALVLTSQDIKFPRNCA
ncbi:hypothetical protein KKA53_05085 [Candidatus Dependentiae bacterium]|nr:hypothetical protein [Candidatus Dependentiae bacterium]